MRRRFFGGEAVSLAKAVVPIELIGAGVPRPGACRRRLERQAQPLFALPKRGLGAGALDRVPGPFGDVADQRDLDHPPRARRRVVGAEGGHQLAAFQQHHSDEGRDLALAHRDALGSVNLGSVSTSLTTTVSPRRYTSLQRRPKAASRRMSGKRGDTACVFTPDDILAIFELGVADSVHAQVFPQKPRGDFLHVERIAQRPQCIGEPEEECLPLFAVGAAVFPRDLRFRHV